ncbi:hypothetical protein [Hymenobacter negativus]|uniref:G-D-S-L family lipolytic protein n=1 Tax=Hymenobacter negativus TaxID=2795026 RepID=A0ABS3QPD6_9BACT|nr:hypothetical protein [Hymenobacter negativus]MBO2013145.1 hypothetical protein [Hymenobacter negativus]
MKNFSLNLGRTAGFIAAATTLLLTACAPGQDTPTPVVNVNVSNYLAVGDTYTAGVSAGGLTRNSQEYSFPNQLARQFQSFSGGGTFTQPIIDGSGSGYLSFLDVSPIGYVRSRRVAGQAVRGTVVNSNSCIIPDTVRLLTRSTTAGTLPQNLGIPGLLLSQINTANLGNQSNATPGGTFNPYFERLLPAADNRTYLQVLTTASTSATFFTFFQGLDDLMPYIRSGGTCGSTPTTNFANTMKQNAKRVLDVLTAGGRQGVIAKLPNITTLPLLSLGQGDRLQARLQASFGDKTLLYIEDPLGIGPGQPISSDDYVLATTLPRIGQLTPVLVGSTTLMLPYGRDVRNPLRDADVLDATTEMNLLTAAVSNYNNNTGVAPAAPGLETLAKTYKLPIITTSTSESALNLNDFLFSQVDGIISVGGVQYSAEPVRGGFFSTDYYSLTPRGNGLLANAFITAINRAYRTNIPAIDVNTLPTIAQ